MNSNVEISSPSISFFLYWWKILENKVLLSQIFEKIMWKCIFQFPLYIFESHEQGRYSRYFPKFWVCHSFDIRCSISPMAEIYTRGSFFIKESNAIDVYANSIYPDPDSPWAISLNLKGFLRVLSGQMFLFRKGFFYILSWWYIMKSNMLTNTCRYRAPDRPTISCSAHERSRARSPLKYDAQTGSVPVVRTASGPPPRALRRGRPCARPARDEESSSQSRFSGAPPLRLSSHLRGTSFRLAARFQTDNMRVTFPLRSGRAQPLQSLSFDRFWRCRSPAC